MKHCDILIPGNYFCDVIFTGIPGFPALGTELYTQNLSVVPGGCLNTITALTRLGVDTGWIGALGTDPFSHVIDTWITQEKIDRRWLLMLDHPLQRVTVALSYPHDRAFVTYVDPAPDGFDRMWQAVENEECSHLHFTGLWVDPRAPDLLKACRARGITVTMDCQHREDTLASPLVREVVGLIDMFMPNAGEAMRLTETASLDAAVEILRPLVPLLLVKDGGNGAQVWQGEQYFAAPAMPVEVVDTTGAGDAFNAGFLAAYRSKADLLTCLKWGNYCGGLSTTGYGGASMTPTRAMVEAYFAEET
ncbi:MAG TPA: carbohydrate kinase family protein [Phototrophicaceae bacterium]|nr:carbohydrate kinase family protein [Phototrophicaceae bacterium]